MNKLTKKAASAVICGAMALTACGCGNTTGTALTIDGEDIRAGIYIYYQMSALDEATSILSEEQPDLDLYAEDFDITAYTVEGVNAEEWIKNKTIDYCRIFVATNKAFDEYGLSLTDEEKAEINDTVTSLWTEENIYAQYFYGVDIIGEYYEGLGIGQQSYKDISTLGYKREAIFNYLYGEGGTLQVSAEEIDAKVAADYALVLSLEIDPVVNTPETYLDMMNSGKSFAEVEQAYNKDSAILEIEAEMGAAEANGEEYTGTLPEDLVVALSEEDDLKEVVSLEENYPSEYYTTEVFAMANDEIKLIADSETTIDDDGFEMTEVTYYLVKRLDITADEAVMDSYRDTALHSLKGDELDETLKTAGAGYGVTENAAAVKKYTVDKLMQ